MLVVGFPVALVLSWAFELTPEGLVRADEATFDSSIRSRHRRKIDFAIIAVLALAVAALLFDRFRSTTKRDVLEISLKSIAVLPFENMSDEKENAFFADGVQDDLLTSLARIRDLKVISRTSVMRYRDPGSRNLREIGQALRVAHIVEGNVRRHENRVRVTVQLLDAREDRNIWAESYDRTISDALSLQGELATEIAAALQATLSPASSSSIRIRCSRITKQPCNFTRRRSNSIAVLRWPMPASRPRARGFTISTNRPRIGSA
jgi:TolB-like protein